MNSEKAFTMIELLFVVGVIAILAAISVPNFLEAQVRSKVARSRTDLAVISMALGRYYADHGAYPPNTPETRRYLDAALQNPIMDSGHTTAPADAKIPWYKDQNAPGPYSIMSETENQDSDSYAGLRSEEFPPIEWNARQLNLLTSPVSYLDSTIKGDIFTRYRKGSLVYINSSELFSDDTATTYPGLWGDHLTSETFYVLGSLGPDNELNIWHPINGPWLPYDPTNGTTSNGDLLEFGGKLPAYSKPPENHRPGGNNDPWGMGMI